MPDEENKGKNNNGTETPPKNEFKETLIRVVTVMAYASSVSMAAMCLSTYYVFFWEPKPPSPDPPVIHSHPYIADPSPPLKLIAGPNPPLKLIAGPRPPLKLIDLQQNQQEGSSFWSSVIGYFQPKDDEPGSIKLKPNPITKMNTILQSTTIPSSTFIPSLQPNENTSIKSDDITIKNSNKNETVTKQSNDIETSVNNSIKNETPVNNSITNETPVNNSITNETSASNSIKNETSMNNFNTKDNNNNLLVNIIMGSTSTTTTIPPETTATPTTSESTTPTTKEKEISSKNDHESTTLDPIKIPMTTLKRIVLSETITNTLITNTRGNKTDIKSLYNETKLNNSTLFENNNNSTSTITVR